MSKLTRRALITSNKGGEGSFPNFSTLSNEYLLRMGGALDQRGSTTQGAWADDIRGWIYMVRDKSGGATRVISRYYNNGQYGQFAESSSSESSVLGHAFLGGEQSTGKLWMNDNANAAGAIRFDYTPGGAPANVQNFVFFSDQTGGSTYDYTGAIPSYDGQYLFTARVVAPEVGDSGTVLFRVYNLATIIAGGPGDYSAQALYEWSIPSGFVSDSAYPLQYISSGGPSVEIVAGFGADGAAFKVRQYKFDGTLLGANDAVTCSSSLVTSDSAGGSVNFEPEGGYWSKDSDNVLRYRLLTATGTVPNRINRIWKVDSNVMFSADNYLARWVAACTANGATPSAGVQASVKTFIQRCIDSGRIRYVTAMWVGWVDSEIAWRTDIFGGKFLTKTGTPNWVAKVGYTGDGGTSNYYTAPMNVGDVPGYAQNMGMFGVYIGTSAQDTGAVLGVNGGFTYCFLQVRNASNLVQSRMNQTTAVNASTAGSVTDASGLWMVNRAVNSGYRVDRNGSTVATYSETTATIVGTAMYIGRSGSTGCTSRIEATYMGYPMTLADEPGFQADVEALKADLQAV